MSNLDTSDQRTDFHRSNIHCSCFLAEANLFFLLVSFDRQGLIHAVSSEQLMLRCVCYLNSVKHLFGLQFLKLVTLMNLSSAAEVTLGLPFISHESQFHHSAWWFFWLHLKELKVLDIVLIEWPSCLKVMMDCHFSLLIWAVFFPIIQTWYFTI